MKSNHKRRGKAWFEKPRFKIAKSHDQPPGSRRLAASMIQKHRKWPLGTVVQVTVEDPATGVRYGMTGTVSKHDTSLPNSCWVEFEHAQPIKGDDWARHCHIISFARMHRATNHVTGN